MPFVPGILSLTPGSPLIVHARSYVTQMSEAQNVTRKQMRRVLHLGKGKKTSLVHFATVFSNKNKHTLLGRNFKCHRYNCSQTTLI